MMTIRVIHALVRWSLSRTPTSWSMNYFFYFPTSYKYYYWWKSFPNICCCNFFCLFSWLYSCLHWCLFSEYKVATAFLLLLDCYSLIAKFLLLNLSFSWLQKLFSKLFHDDITYLLSMDKLWTKRRPPTPLCWDTVLAQEGTGEISAFLVLKKWLIYWMKYHTSSLCTKFIVSTFEHISHNH